ncbi:MAG: asparagine synthase-related protein [Gemmatimonadaceae bacterium]
MSAIGAVFRHDGAPVPASEMAMLLGSMSEYGTEATMWSPGSDSAPVALGCIPWRVTPEDAWYRGPVHSADGRLVVVADARIDNRAELAAELGIPAAEAATLPDAAFILAAYDAWEQDCARHLLGDFAFVLWDQRQRALICARDVMGQRVLFYHATSTRIALATTAHALVSLPDVPARLNEQKVADFLVLLQRPEITFFEGILRLPPAHTMRVDASGVRLEPYWSAEPIKKIEFGSNEEYLEGFLDVFGQAVRSRLRCDGEVGIMASGGLDSSSVAVVAAEQLREQGRGLTTFHAAPRVGLQVALRRDQIADESADVEAIARMHPNIDLRIRRPDGRTPFDEIETLFRMTGALPRNPGNVAWFTAIYAAARSEGLKVLLAGHKGNATISHTGDRSLRDSAARGQWGRVWREVHAIARATGQGRRNVFERQVVMPLVPSFLSAARRTLARQPTSTTWEDNSSAINPEFARAMLVEERVREARRDSDTIRRMTDRNFRLTVLANSADGLDVYSGFRPWFGVETRDPTGDRRVIEYCFGVSGAKYLQNGVNRWLIRSAMAGRLPDQVRLRTTFGAQDADWPELLPSMRNEIKDELDRLDRSETAKRCLDLPRMRSLVERWPEQFGRRQEKEYYLLLLRGVMMGRFIRWFEETYS